MMGQKNGRHVAWWRIWSLFSWHAQDLLDGITFCMTANHWGNRCREGACHFHRCIGSILWHTLQIAHLLWQHAHQQWWRKNLWPCHEQTLGFMGGEDTVQVHRNITTQHHTLQCGRRKFIQTQSQWECNSPKAICFCRDGADGFLNCQRIGMLEVDVCDAVCAEEERTRACEFYANLIFTWRWHKTCFLSHWKSCPLQNLNQEVKISHWEVDAGIFLCHGMGKKQMNALLGAKQPCRKCFHGFQFQLWQSLTIDSWHTTWFVDWSGMLTRAFALELHPTMQKIDPNCWQKLTSIVNHLTPD